MLQKRKVRIGYIDYSDPCDRRRQSGIAFMICRALTSMGAEIIWIPIKETKKYKLMDFTCKVICKLLNKTIMFKHTLSASKELAKSINKKSFDNIDVFLCINSSSAFASLELNKPLIYRSDATFNLMVDYYFHNLSPKNIEEGNKIEQAVLDKATVVLYPSQWVKNSAINDYNQPEDKLFVVESGVNIDKKDINAKYTPYVEGGILNLLFLGVDWQRKGGDIAIEACKYLLNKSIDVKLHIVGIKELASNIKQLPYVNNVGFLNKNNPDEYKKLVSLIQSSQALILPTIAECSGNVFSESSAFGLPSFTHDTGGVGNYVIDGVNGYRLSLGSTGNDFGEKIYNCLKSGELETLSKQSIELYNNKLNWEVWQEKVEKIINNIL